MECVTVVRDIGGPHKILLGEKQIGRVYFWECGSITAFEIDQQFRGKGYGTQVLGMLKKLAKQKNIRCIKLNCAHDRINFYKRNGFVRNGKDKRTICYPFMMKCVV